EPTDIDVLRERRELVEVFDGAVVAMVPLLQHKGTAVRLNITMDRDLVAEIDRLTNNRSAWLADAARQKIVG
ncbi:MAG: HicB family protein, partial [Alphaproteobacteria bacterium]